MGKATGPRTARGKARSSKNAAKHWIESGRILEQEEREAAILRDGFIADFHPNGSIECEIIDDLVFNRLVKRRIDSAFTREFSKANAEKQLSIFDKYDNAVSSYWQRAMGNKRRGIKQERLPPELCIAGLVSLKDDIVKQGVEPAKVLIHVQSIFGDEPTENAAIICGNLVELASAPPSTEPGDSGSPYPDLLQSTIDAFDAEIARQKLRRQLVEQALDSECATEIQEPLASVLETLLRYRAANIREFRHLLSSFESIRRLRSDAA
jgi:hypothetical protein